MFGYSSLLPNRKRLGDLCVSWCTVMLLFFSVFRMCENLIIDFETFPFQLTFSVEFIKSCRSKVELVLNKINSFLHFAAWYFDCSIIKGIIAIKNEAMIIGWVVGGLRRSRAWCMRRRRVQTRRRLDAAYNADIVQSTPFHELQTLAYTERKIQVSTPFPRPAVFSLIILPKE